MKLEKIYRDLGFSIRKVNKDEIEIRDSLWDGYLRGLFRALIIGSLLVVSFVDYKHGYMPLSYQYKSIKKEFIFGFRPDEIIKPMYKKDLITMQSEEFKKDFPNSPVYSYDEYKSDYNDRISKNKFWFIFHMTVIFVIFLLFFYPRHRCLRLNRKERVIYSQNFVKTVVTPVPEKGDPLAGMKYNRFSVYMFGTRRQFSLLMTMMVIEGEFIDGKVVGDYTDAKFLGCYPLPNNLHNMHLVKAMREFFTQENPEFLNHIGRFYRTPWCRPGIAFCNAFAFIRFPIFRRKKADAAIAKFKQHWNGLSEKEKQQRFNAAIAEQDRLNYELTVEGFHNEVNDDWHQEETSPALVNL